VSGLPVLRRRRAPARFRRVAALATLAAVASSCGFSLQAFPKLGSHLGPSYHLYATFTNVLNLPANAQVRDGSAVIGEVGSISAHDFKADLTLDIRKDVHLPVGTTAQVRFDSPLGDEYVLVTEPHRSGGAVLERDAHIPVADTSTAPSVEDTLTALGAVLNGGGIDQLQTIVVELNNTFSGNQTQIRDVLGQLATTLKSLSDHTGDITSAIAAVGSLARQLNAGRTVITDGIDAIAPSVTVLSKENGDLRDLLTQLTRLSTVTNRIVTTSGQDSIADAHALLPVVNQLVGVEEQVGPDLADIARFEAMTPKIAPGNYLQVAITLNVAFNSAPVTATAVGDNADDTSYQGPRSGAAAVTAILETGLP
jgi:phospholipid/cholesterol/gamma-HCH transport system substrate-binding protein